MIAPVDWNSAYPDCVKSIFVQIIGVLLYIRMFTETGSNFDRKKLREKL